MPILPRARTALTPPLRDAWAAMRNPWAAQSTLRFLVLGGLPIIGAADAVAAAQAIGEVGETDIEGPRVLWTTRLIGPAPAIDGRLEDAAWADAPAAIGFIQSIPRVGEPASRPTEARVAYDANAIYVALRMFDAPDSISTRLGRRDVIIGDSDWVHVLIDGQYDRRSGFWFGVNPSGVKLDAIITNDVGHNANWDAVWEVATSVDSLGWVAEFRIPFSQLRFTQSAGEQVWGINFMRVVARLNEQSFWAPTPPRAGRLVSMFGELRGLEGLRSPRNLEFLPYSLGRATRAPIEAANPFYRRLDPFWTAGADLKFGVTSNFTLTATVNPDFGQVEADPSEVNLSAFETFFPERRPFFLEGAEIFELGNLFYSRRIGRSPQRPLSIPNGYVKSPESSSILGAAKLTGRTAGGWTIGALNAVTAREEARTAEAFGEQGTIAVEPLTNYGVLRIRRDLRGGASVIGGILTSTNRALRPGDDLDFLRASAYTGAVGWRHRFAANTYETQGYLAGSHIAGSREALRRTQLSPVHYFQRPDATHLDYDSTRTAMAGAYGFVNVRKIAGRIRGTLTGSVASPGYELNDLGSNNQTDRIGISLSASYHSFTASSRLESWSIGGTGGSAWTFGREHIEGRVAGNGSLRLLSGWGATASFGRSFATLSTFALRGGPALMEPGGYAGSIDVYTDSRRPVSVRAGGGASREDDTGNRSTGFESAVSLRPSTRTQLSLGADYSRGVSSMQYVAQQVALDERRYVLSHLEQRTLSLIIRASHTFAPNLSLELYGRPFVSSGAFSDYRMVTDPRAARLADRTHVFTPGQITYDANTRLFRVDIDADGTGDLRIANRDFNFKQFRSNAVLRWEYRPGSTLFVIWSQDRDAVDPDTRFSPRHDLRDLFGTSGRNVLLIKVNYWLSS